MVNFYRLIQSQKYNVLIIFTICMLGSVSESLTYFNTLFKPESLLKVILSSYATMFVLILPLFFIRRFFIRIILSILISFILTVLFSMNLKYGGMSIGVVAAIYESNLSESYEFLSSHSLYKELIFFCVISLLFILLSKTLPVFKDNERFFTLTAVVFLFSVSVILGRAFINQGSNLNIKMMMISLGGGYTTGFNLYQANKLLLDEKAEITSEWGSASTQTPDNNYVIVIGESVQQKAFSKVVEKEAQSLNGWVLFSNAIAPATQTRYSLPRLLSVNDRQGLNYNLNIIDLANEIGLKTYWFSNQARVSDEDTPTSRLAMRTDEYLFHNMSYIQAESDFILIDDLKSALEENVSGNLFFLHMIGSHGNYCVRVGLQASDDQKMCYDKTLDKLINFLKSVELTLNQQTAPYKIAYVSDHGLTDIDEIPYKTHGVGKLFSFDAVNTPLIFIDQNTKENDLVINDKEYFLRDMPHTFAGWLGINNRHINSDKSVHHCYQCQDRFVIDAGRIIEF